MVDENIIANIPECNLSEQNSAIPRPSHADRIAERKRKNTPWPPPSFIDCVYADWLKDGADEMPDASS